MTSRLKTYATPRDLIKISNAHSVHDSLPRKVLSVILYLDEYTPFVYKRFRHQAIFDHEL